MPNELHNAAADKNGFNKVKELLKANPSLINEKHTEHKTPVVYFAAQSGSLETLKFLINQNANIDASADEYNLLFWATQNSPEVIEYVTNPDNKLIERFNDGTTYFHAAIVAGKNTEVKNEEVMTQLNNDPDLAYSENNKSKSSIFWALRARNEVILASLINILGNDLLSQDPKWPEHLDKILQCEMDFDDKEGHLDLFEKLKFYFDLLLPQDEKSLAANYFSIRITCYLTYLHLKNKNHVEVTKYLINVEERFKKMLDYFFSGTMEENKYFTKEHMDKLCRLLDVFREKLSLDIKAMERGLHCIAEKEARSFYTAMVNQLHELNDPVYNQITDNDLRTIAYNHILKNKHLYQDFIEEGITGYLQEIMSPDSFPDQIAILALSREFNMTFYILKGSRNDLDIFKPCSPYTTLKFACMEGSYYFPLRVNSELQPKTLIEKEIDNADKNNFDGVLISRFVPSIKKDYSEKNDDDKEEISKKSVRPRGVGLFASSSVSSSLSSSCAKISTSKDSVNGSANGSENESGKELRK